MSVSLLLGLVYLISELLLTYSTSSRHGGQAKAGSAAPLAQPHKDEAGSEYIARRGRLTEPWLQPFRSRHGCLYSCSAHAS
jgi:hypothetical protein